MRGGFGFGPGPGRGRDRRAGDSAPTGDAARGGYVVELELPLQQDGTYARVEGEAFAPKLPLWTYGGGDGEARFSSPIVSGSQRLPNGNTLITSGAEGYCVEVDAAGQVVWEFRSPFGRESAEGEAGGREGGGFGPGGPGRGGFGRGGGGPGGFGGFGGAFYRATRIASDHPALRGRELAAPTKKKDV